MTKSGSKIASDGQWVPRIHVHGDDYEVSDHPDLLRAMRGLAEYDNWVSQRLLPIAHKWIDEHRDEVLAGLSEDQRNDVGAVIEAAFRIIERSDWMKQRRQASTEFSEEDSDINPMWLKRTLALVDAEQSIKEAYRNKS